MKKFIYILMISILVLGCNKESSNQGSSIVLYDSSYQVRLPYKKSVGNYVLDDAPNYSITSVDKELMQFSTAYYNPDRYLYESGQYLTSEILKDLLSNDKLNSNTSITVNNEEVIPNYISYIYEQNYVSIDKDIKGISLAIGVNRYIKYQNEYGTVKYQEIDKETVIEAVKSKMSILVDYMYTIDELKNSNILLTIYLLPKPNSSYEGVFTDYAYITDKTIEFVNLNYTKTNLASEYSKNNNLNLYNNYKNMINEVRELYSDLYISSEGVYLNDKLEIVKIIVTTIPKSTSELMAISQEIAKRLSFFATDTSIKVYIKESNKTMTILIKEKGNTDCKIYMIGE